jgi:hypothetical protein
MSSPSNPRSGPAYKRTAAQLLRVLRGFSPEFDDAQLPKPMCVFPVPRSTPLTAILAREVMMVFGAVDLGQDVEDWQYGFTVDDVPCVLACVRRRLHVALDLDDADAAKQLAERVVDRLGAGQRVVNKSLSARLKSRLPPAIEAGEVTMVNQYVTLRGSYEYFRSGAEQAYAGSGRLADSLMWADMFAGHGAQEGWWNTHAMATAYFSMLEHVLVGCLPFTSFDPANGNLRTVIVTDSWHEKMSRVIKLNNADLPSWFGELCDIGHRVRNMYSHGTFNAKGGAAAISVELPDVGPVPVAVGEFGASPELLFVGGDKDYFDHICAVFDTCDGWLTNGPLADGYKWVLEGLEFRFDAQFRADAADARNKGRFDEFLSAASIRMDDEMNGDI